jgi:hypothetical protein
LDRWRKLPRWRRIGFFVVLIVGFGPWIFAYLISILAHVTIYQVLDRIPYFICLWLGFIYAGGIFMLGWFIWKHLRP